MLAQAVTVMKGVERPHDRRRRVALPRHQGTGLVEGQGPADPPAEVPREQGPVERRAAGSARGQGQGHRAGGRQDRRGDAQARRGRHLRLHVRRASREPARAARHDADDVAGPEPRAGRARRSDGALTGTTRGLLNHG
eukprot:TRINITY_DN8948_c1_g1_i4.p3 TRINITY_DN8948_c1_g1~~TRINITY_DN8948_c1_g1_i4.p3  ORF type:complete len:156 (-),score=19.82 TRINITY_DN8948_c1_g1_i4:304-717(-)